MRARGDRGAVPVATLAIALAIAGGLVVGSILGFTGALDLFGESDTIASAAAAPYYGCPGDASSAGVLHRGDRVFATGRTQDAAWIQVRSPRSSDARVWLAANDLDPDADLLPLPVLPCAVVVEVSVETTTTVPGDTTTTTTVPGDTTTTSVADTTTTVAATTTTVAVTTTTLAPPSVGQVSESHDPIWESYAGFDDCNGVPSQFNTSVISATITAPAGVQSVTMFWSVGDQNGSKPMTLNGGMYRATLGPFQAEEPSVVPPNQSLPITVAVSVTDSLGRVATRQTTVTLNDCTFG